VETREQTAQAEAKVAYQLGNVNVQSIDPLLQLAASPEEMWNIVAREELVVINVEYADRRLVLLFSEETLPKSIVKEK